MGDETDHKSEIRIAERCAFSTRVRVRNATAQDRAAFWPPSAMQRFWRTATTFHECPEAVTADGMREYADRLGPGVLTCSNTWGESFLIRAELMPGDVLAMLSTLPPPHTGPQAALCFVFIEHGRFVHQSHGMYWVPETCLRDLDAALGRLPVEFYETNDDQMHHAR